MDRAVGVVPEFLDDSFDGAGCLLDSDLPPEGSEWIISIGDYVDNSFTALGSSYPREVRLEL